MKKNPIDHVKDRPDMYIGSTQSEALEEFVVSPHETNPFHIEKQKIDISPGILRIFVEPLSNAIDNVADSKENKVKMTKIAINIDEETGQTSIWNDGSIIPIEKHEDTGLYNHTLLFGELLSGSKYDDEQERLDISGKNGLGVKCFAVGTELRSWNGEIKRIEEFRLGDYLIGDDGTQRRIIGMKEGNGMLYEIHQQFGDSYTVNKHHILCLRYTPHKLIQNNDRLYYTNYVAASTSQDFCIYSRAICSCCRGVALLVHEEKEEKEENLICECGNPKIGEYSNSSEAKEKLQNYLDTISDDNRVEMSVEKYLKTCSNLRKELVGYIGEPIQYEKKSTEIDPYIVGLLLSSTVAFTNDTAIMYIKNIDKNVIFYLSGWGSENDISFSFKGKNCTCVDNFAAFYVLYSKTKLPGFINDYLYNSEENRSILLAGIIDGCGKFYNDSIQLRNLSFLEELAKSLGFSVRYKESINSLSIQGDFKTIPFQSNENKLPLSVTPNNGNITIEKVKSGMYIGLKVSGNERFVLPDHTVVHNCTNVFSTSFTVEGVDPQNKKKFVQTWSNNMKTASEPIITSSTLKTGYTKVTYTPDFKLFGLENYTPDILSFYKRLIVDTAMLTKLNVYYNDEKIDISSLAEYARLYEPIKKGEKDKKDGIEENEKNLEEEPATNRDLLTIKAKNCEVVVTTSSSDFEAISFANGIYTPQGGTHVDAWCEAIFRPLLQKFNKPNKPEIKISDIKKFFRLFVVATVAKPTFDSQSKLKLKGPQVEAEAKKSHISAINSWNVIERIEDMVRMKEMGVLKKAERKKRGYTKVEGLEPANNEGGKNGRNCSLILVEGLSAKTYAAKGISEGIFGRKGRDWNGIIALRGKVLNTRNAKPKTVSENKVIKNIIHALNLQHDVDYTIDENFYKLRYGKVVIITDADVDGFHITGLLQNFFHSLFPSLLKRKEPFLYSMQTPIVRVFLNKGEDLLFYDEREYRNYVTQCSEQFPGKKINKKYYKGLGSSKDSDIRETFGQKMIEYKEDEKTFDMMLKAFHTKYADQRKDWIAKYDSNNIVVKWEKDKKEHITVSLSDFIDTEMIKFSIDDCKRSIPNLMDGLKEGQRKVLYSCFLKKLKYTGKEMKVGQLSGYVSQKTNYHHGEANLDKTIAGMAVSFVGSNNIPYLTRDGQLGSRSQGGKDSAEPRYTFTRLDKLTRLIFRVEDDPLLDPIDDDGDIVEPHFYVPIIPMGLVNGCLGIGTGWSTNIPSYNPLDLIECIKIWLNEDGNVFRRVKRQNQEKDEDKENNPKDENCDTTTVSILPEIKPWYRGFTGDIIYQGNGKYTTYGVLERLTENKVRVTDLPIGYWTDDFKDYLEELREEKKIKSYINNTEPEVVDFTILECEGGIECDFSSLKLTTHLHTTNMVLFTEEERIKKYSCVDEIIDDFCKVRYSYYTKRKEYRLKDLEYNIMLLGNKRRFLEEVRDKKLDLFDSDGKKNKFRKTSAIVSDLEEHKYDKILREEKEKKGGDGDEEEEEEEEEEGEEKDKKKGKKGDKEKSNKHGYEYLLQMRIDNITDEKINKLKNDIYKLVNERDDLKETSEKQLWLSDLEEFEKEYPEYIKILDNELAAGKKIEGKKKRGK